MLCMKRILILGLTLAHGLTAAPLPEAGSNTFVTVQSLSTPSESASDVSVNEKPAVVRVEHNGVSNKVQAVGNGAVDAVAGAIKGVIGAVMHPWTTMYNVGHSVIHPIQTIKSIGNNIKDAYAKDPYHAFGASVANVGMAFVPVGWGAKTAQGQTVAAQGAKIANQIDIVAPATGKVVAAEGRVAGTAVKESAKLTNARVVAANSANQIHFYENQLVQASQKLATLRSQKLAATSADVGDLARKVAEAETAVVNAQRSADLARVVESNARSVYKARIAYEDALTKIQAAKAANAPPDQILLAAPSNAKEIFKNAQLELAASQAELQASRSLGWSARASEGIAGGFDAGIVRTMDAGKWTAGKITSLASAAKATTMSAMQSTRAGNWVLEKSSAAGKWTKEAVMNNPRKAGVAGSAGVVGLENSGQNPPAPNLSAKEE